MFAFNIGRLLHVDVDMDVRILAEECICHIISMGKTDDLFRLNIYIFCTA